MKSNNLKKLVALATSLALTATLVTACGTSNENNEKNNSNNISSSNTNTKENSKEDEKNEGKEENKKDNVDSSEDKKEEDKEETEDKKEEDKKEENKVESKPETKPESKPAPKPEQKPTPTPTPTPKPESKPEPKPETKPDPKPETKPEEKPEVKLTASEITDILVSTHYQASLMDSSSEISNLYYMSSDLFNSYTIRIPMMMVHAAEIAVFEVKDGKMEDAKAGALKRQADLDKNWGQYLPAQHDLVKNYRLVSNGNYLLFTIADDSDAVVSTFNDIVDGKIDIKAVE